MRTNCEDKSSGDHLKDTNQSITQYDDDDDSPRRTDLLQASKALNQAEKEAQQQTKELEAVEAQKEKGAQQKSGARQNREDKSSGDHLK